MRSVDEIFTTVSRGVNRALNHLIRFSWTREEDDDTFFAQVGVSQIGDSSVIRGGLDNLTRLDIFVYEDESEYVKHVEFEKQLVEPLGGISYSQAAVILANIDRRFELGGGSEIEDYILPNRPVQIFLGFKISGLAKNLLKISGLTKPPTVNAERTLATMELLDFLVYLQTVEIGQDVTYVNKRSDEIIADILEDKVGFASSQFELDEGLNTIPFIYFTNEQNVSDILKQICEAEGAYLFQDEEGVIRFWTRNKWAEAPYSVPIMTINKDRFMNPEVIDWVPTINSIRIKSNARVVQDQSVIYTLESPLEMAALETKEFFVNFEDPAYSIEDIAINPTDSLSDLIANTQADGGGSDRRDDINANVDKFILAAKIILQNTANETVFITKLQLRGQLALASNPPIDEQYKDLDSQAKYGRIHLDINNEAINDKNFAKYLAEATVKKYSEPLQLKKITIRALPQLQVGDLIYLEE